MTTNLPFGDRRSMVLAQLHAELDATVLKRRRRRTATLACLGGSALAVLVAGPLWLGSRGIAPGPGGSPPRPTPLASDTLPAPQPLPLNTPRPLVTPKPNPQGVADRGIAQPAPPVRPSTVQFVRTLSRDELIARGVAFINDDQLASIAAEDGRFVVAIDTGRPRLIRVFDDPPPTAAPNRRRDPG